MLEELKNLKFIGRKEDLLFFLQTVIGDKALSQDAIKAIYLHSPRKFTFTVESLICYCKCFKWIIEDSKVFLEATLLNLIINHKDINDELIYRTVSVLFEEGVFSARLFSYDSTKERFIFRNEYLPLCFSSIRNVLISQDFLFIERNQGTVFYLNSQYEELLENYCKKHTSLMTLVQLKKSIEENEKAGAMAEDFALAFEMERLNETGLSSKIRSISSVDVGAGYDIVSFQTMHSTEYDRFIEVKAISGNYEFFWSANEYDTAKIKGEKYFLYLVDLQQINQPTYEPLIIGNPAESIIKSENWLVKAQTYRINKV